MSDSPRPDPREPDYTRPLFAECPHCGGSGELIFGEVTSRWADAPSERTEPCDACNGVGEIETECDLITQEDLR